MRLLRYVPITFICGVHGFAFFVPYLAVFLTATHLLRRRRQHGAGDQVRGASTLTSDR